jgi:hypothetical protein
MKNPLRCVICTAIALAVLGFGNFKYQKYVERQELRKIKLLTKEDSGTNVETSTQEQELLFSYGALLMTNKPILIGGLEQTGGGDRVRMACFIQLVRNADDEPTGLKGWSYSSDPVEGLSPGFQYFESSDANTARRSTKLCPPMLRADFMAEINPGLIEPTADPVVLRELADRALAVYRE